MIKPKLILIGGGGHCKSCIDVIEQEDKYIIAGILDIREKVGEEVLGYKIIGIDTDIEKLNEEGYYFLLTVGQIKSAKVRKKLFEKLKYLQAKVVTIISPLAYVSKHVQIAEGTIVMHRAIINTGSIIGQNNIINTACVIEHDVIIGNHNHISTGAFINGDCNIGNEVFIGSQATIANQISIGNEIVIGAGTIVYKNIKSSGIWVGNPMRQIK